MPNSSAVIPYQSLLDHLQGLDRSRRWIVAITGAPGSGKSTLVERLATALNAENQGTAAVVPMDGFHFDDGLLQSLGRLAFKGAPDTFDVGGLRSLLGRLQTNDEARIAVPLFDRQLEISRAGAAFVDQTAKIILVEGNYLLLSSDPWSALRPYFDLTVTLAVAEPILRQRLIARWLGYGMTPAEATRKVETVDLPNGRQVRDESAAADLLVNGE